MKVKITMAVTLEVHVELQTRQEYASGPTGNDIARWQREAVAQIDNFTPEQITDALERAKETGRSYPGDVAEWISTDCLEPHRS